MSYIAANKDETLVDTAYRSIRKDIIEETLPAGEKINVLQLSRSYGISPTPIKQALNRLVAEGLIESVPHKGSVVRKMTLEEISEMFEIRLMMETHFIPAVMQAVQQSLTIRQLFEQNIRENTELAESFSAWRSISKPTRSTGSSTSCSSLPAATRPPCASIRGSTPRLRRLPVSQAAQGPDRRGHPGTRADLRGPARGR